MTLSTQRRQMTSRPCSVASRPRAHVLNDSVRVASCGVEVGIREKRRGALSVWREDEATALFECAYGGRKAEDGTVGADSECAYGGASDAAAVAEAEVAAEDDEDG